MVEIRGFGTKARIGDILSKPADMIEDKKKEIKELLLEDAKKLVSQELGRENNPLTDQEYLEWFAETLGENVGLMHKNGWVHGFLHDHNITLDCRIADLGSVKQIDREIERRDDKSRARVTLQSLIRELGLKNRVSEFENQFEKSYDSVFPPEERKFLK